MPVKPIPDGYHSVTPYLVCRGAAKAIDYYKSVFGAEEVMRMPAPGGRVGHAELRIGDSVVMLADENPEVGARSPESVGGTPVSLMVYVADVDATYKKALAGGAREIRALANQFYGDRSGTITDPFGHQWTIATHVEDVSPEEMQRRMAKAPGQGQPA